jgi:LPXTG-site transpeptidase (sortase) family protein
MTAKTDSRTRLYSLIGVLNLAVGLMFYVVTTSPPPTSSIVVATPMPKASLATRVVPAVSGTPVRIVIPKLSLDLPVDVGSYDPKKGDWTISDTKAYYADVSVPVNDSNGATFIYGHARPAVFGPLLSMQPDTIAYVYTDNGHVFKYAYKSTRQVRPSDMSGFNANGPPRLVLQTCIGPWDAYRALYSFSLVSKERA